MHLRHLISVTEALFHVSSYLLTTATEAPRHARYYSPDTSNNPFDISDFDSTDAGVTSR